MEVLAPYYKIRKVVAYGLLAALASLFFFLLQTGEDTGHFPVPPFRFNISNSPPQPFDVPFKGPSPKGPDILGVQVTDIHEEDLRHLHLQSKSGVLIKKVRLNSAAEGAGLQPADIIHEINKARVDSVHDYRRALHVAKNTGIMEMEIERRGTVLDVSILIIPSGD